MERVMYDVYVAEATMENDYQNFNTPEKKEAYINKVFKENKTTQARWDTSLSWYSDRIDIYLKMNDSVKARLQRARQGVDALVALKNQSTFIDPATLPASYIPPMYSFSMPYMGRGFRFSMDTTEISSKVTGNDFQFSFSAIGIPPHFSSPFTSLLAVAYGDTTIYQLQEIWENRNYEFIGSKYITGDTITGISGFVRLQDSTAMMPHIQLYNIYFGEKKHPVSQTDSLGESTDYIDTTPLMEDSVMIQEKDSIQTIHPD